MRPWLLILLSLALSSPWSGLSLPETEEAPAGTLAVDGLRLGMSAAEAAHALGRPTLDSYTAWGERGDGDGWVSLTPEDGVDQVFGGTLTRDGVRQLEDGWSQAAMFTALGEGYYFREELAVAERYSYLHGGAQQVWVLVEEGRVNGIGLGPLEADYRTVLRLSEFDPARRECWHRLMDLRGTALRIQGSIMAEGPRTLRDFPPGALVVEPRCPAGAGYSFSTRYCWLSGYWVTVGCPVHHLEAADSRQWFICF